LRRVGTPVEDKVKQRRAGGRAQILKMLFDREQLLDGRGARPAVSNLITVAKYGVDEIQLLKGVNKRQHVTTDIVA
jgi:hypothetical protein